MPELLVRLQQALAHRYRIERWLGGGALGTVYLAQDLRLARAVALKVLKPELTAAIDAEWLLAQMEINSKLDHPHILSPLDSEKVADFVFYTTPYVVGESLRARLVRERRLDVETVVGIAKPAGEALTFAHERGVLHCDVKPEKFLISHGHSYVRDFAVMQAFLSAAGKRLTSPGFVGMRLYISPEQARGEDIAGAESDVYSLGCVIYEMLAGNPPSWPPHLPLGRTGGGPPRLRDVPAAVDAVVRRALAMEPRNRHATPAALASALAEAALPSNRPGPKLR